MRTLTNQNPQPNTGRDIDKAFLEALYERIVSNEIRMKGGEDDKGTVVGAAKDGKGKVNDALAAPYQAARIGLDLLLNLLPLHR